MQGEGMVKEIAACDRVYKSGSLDKFLMYLDSGLANQYSDGLSEDITRGINQLLERGLWPGRPPLGYIRDPRYRDDPQLKDLLPDPERFERVRQMWRLRLSGVPISDIVKLARNDWELRTARFRSAGGAIIPRSRIYRMFTDPFYAGVMTRAGKAYPGRHEAMVTQAEFRLVQDAMNGYGRHRGTDSGGVVFPYRGLVLCGSCGAKVTSKTTTNKLGRTYKHYYCSRKNRCERWCKEGAVQESVIDQALAKYFRELQPAHAWFRLARRRLIELESAQARTDEVAQAAVEKRLEEVQRRLARLRTLLVDEVISEQDYEQDRKRLIEEQIRLRQSQKRGQEPKLVKLFEEANSLLSRAPELFESDATTEKSLLARIAVVKLTLQNKTVLVEAKKPFSLFRERPSCPGLWRCRELNSGLERVMDTIFMLSSFVLTYSK